VADADRGPRPTGEQAIERGVDRGDVVAVGVARSAIARRAAALYRDDVADRRRADAPGTLDVGQASAVAVALVPHGGNIDRQIAAGRRGGRQDDAGIDLVS